VGELLYVALQFDEEEEDDENVKDEESDKEIIHER
jgi:hypothetical protein